MAFTDADLAKLNVLIDKINLSHMEEFEKIDRIIPILNQIINRIETIYEKLDRNIENYAGFLENAKNGLELANSQSSKDFNLINHWKNGIKTYEYKLFDFKNKKREIPYLKNKYEKELFEKLDRKTILLQERNKKWAAEYENGKFEKYFDYAWRFGIAGIGLIVSGTVIIITSPIWIPFALFLLSKSFYDDKSFKNTLENLFEPELPPSLAKEENQKSTFSHFSSPLSSLVNKDNQQNVQIESINTPLMQII